MTVERIAVRNRGTGPVSRQVTEQSDRQIAVFDRLSIVHPPVGQSLFAVLEKRAAR